MKCLIVLALVAAASASVEFGTVVEGTKAIIAGPSGTINADTGSIIKSGASALGAAVVAPRVIASAPLLAPSSIYAPRVIASSPLLDSRLIAPSPYLTHSAPLVASGLGLGSPLLGARIASPLASPLLSGGLISPVLGSRSILDSGLYGARSIYGSSLGLGW